MAKVIRLTENQFGEMMAYHGSKFDFDKFNHKKYLSKGAGSQCFGWGTYITSDEVIGKSYAKNRTIDVYTYKEELPEVLEKAYGQYGMTHDLACKVLDKFYSIMNGFNFPVQDTNEEVIDRQIEPYVYEIPAKSRRKYIKLFLTIINYCRVKCNSNNFLYEVDIPDDNGFNYISWYEPLTNKQINYILSGLFELENRANKLFSNGIRSYKTGKDIYGFLAKNFANAYDRNLYLSSWPQKATSLFLLQCGFDGIKYPAGTKWQKPDGASENAMNYVIFDSNKVKIVNKTKV